MVHNVQIHFQTGHFEAEILNLSEGNVLEVRAIIAKVAIFEDFSQICHENHV